MKAAVLTGFRQPLQLVERADPQPAADEVIVRVRVAGLCGTDLKLVGGDFPDLALPLVPGHEIAGELENGERVACYFYDPCGECRLCRAGNESVCPSSRRLGFERDGGFAELVAVPRRNVLPVPAGLALEEAALAMDAVLTPWHALHVRGRVQPDESVLIVGAGGLGLNAVQIAVAAGASVSVVDPVDEHREAAVAFGASAELPTEVDLVVELSGVRAGLEAAVSSVRPGGRIVCVGYKPGVEYGLDSARLALGELSLIGSRVGSREDARAALAAVARREVRPKIADRLALEEVNRALDRLAAVSVTGRIVLHP